MEIKLTDRIQLKEYFRKNKIPRESDFAEFIDASINQREDGIVKNPGDPLSIEAVGEVAGVLKLLNFYRKLSDAAPLWSLNASATKADRVVAGLDVTNGSGKSAIFIAEGSGNVGFGTVTPKGRVHVTEDVVVGNDADNQKFIIHSRSENGGDYLQVAPETGNGWNWNGGIVIKRDGSVGIGTVPAKGMLHINGETTIDGGNLNVNKDLINPGHINFGSSVMRQMLNLWSIKYGIGIQSRTMYFRSDQNFSWYIQGTHSNGELDPGSGGELALSLSKGAYKIGSAQYGVAVQILNKEEDANGRTLILGPDNSSNLRMGYHKDYSWIQSHGSKPLSVNPLGNNVGIGLLSPKATLHVGGDIAIGNDKTNQKFIIHSRTANNGDVLHITPDNDKGGWDWGIGITLARKSGNVGIGITSPSAKLHVNGDVRVDGYVHVKQQVAFNAYLATNDQSGEKDVLPLTNVSINYGECFDVKTSKFTAPVNGVYLFTMTMFRVSDNDIHWYLMVNSNYANIGGTSNNENSERSLLSVHHKHVMCSRTMMVFLKKGDAVHVKQHGSGRCDNYRSGLSGVLLCAMA